MGSMSLTRTEVLGLAAAIWLHADELVRIAGDDLEMDNVKALASHLDALANVPIGKGEQAAAHIWRSLTSLPDGVDSAGPGSRSVELSHWTVESVLDYFWTLALNTGNWDYRAHALAWILELDSRRPQGMDTSLISERREWMNRVLAPEIAAADA